MPTQTATTDQLEHAQNVVIAAWRFTGEHNAPCVKLIDKFTLGKGDKTYRFPKVGQVEFSALQDGIDMVDSQSIGLTYVDASPSEVGARFILTDKLVRQASDDAFMVIGRQLGDGYARKVDTDIITLFADLDNAWGKASAPLGMAQAAGLATLAVVYKFIAPIYMVHHPNAMGTLMKSNVGMLSALGVAGSSGAALPAGSYDRGILSNFFVMSLNGVQFYQDGNIAKIAAATSGYGAIFSKSAMAMVSSKEPYTERERDASLRAWEVNMVADYKVAEVDGSMGGSARYEIGDIRTT